MKTYTCNGFRSVRAETMSGAAEIFAAREARKQFGRGGYARTCTQGSHSENMQLAEYSAFIGYTPAGKHNAGLTVGHNYCFTVYAQ